jgi:Methyltransferase domain
VTHACSEAFEGRRPGRDDVRPAPDVLRDVVAPGGWFDRTYGARLGRRCLTMKAALGLVLQGGGRTIVETGSVRTPEGAEVGWFGDGCSTVVFGAVAARYGLHLWTVDADPEATATARRRVGDVEHVTYVTADAPRWLAGFDRPIDLLYLDSLDCPEEGDATEAQAHQRRELLAALPRLTRQGVVLLDDNAFANGGKTRLAKASLARAGWRCLLDDAQSLWLAPAGCGA